MQDRPQSQDKCDDERSEEERVRLRFLRRPVEDFYDATSRREHVSVKRMVVRLAGVEGLQGRRNDVLFLPARKRASAPPALVYWGGDVQDYPEAMQAHRDNHLYLKWNLESTARGLGADFPTHHVVLVRPSRIVYKSISCYDNFVPSNNAGVPAHVSSHSALQHLFRLLQEVSDRLKEMPEEELLATLDAASVEHNEDLHSVSPLEGSSAGGSAHPGPRSSLQAPEPRLWWRPCLELHDSRLTLAGFSKGCVVLNQLLHEFHYTQTDTHADTSVAKIISHISAMYWLDGGHAGGRDTWLTSRRLLETLAKLNVEIFVHVSPYQVQDEARPWIGKEEKVFTGTLRKLGANIHRYLHEAGNAPVTLNTHFSVVSNFRWLQQSSETDSDSSGAVG